MGADDLTAALSWLHERLGHTFTVDAGTLILDGVVLRGGECRGISLVEHEPGSESYMLKIYTLAFMIDLHTDDLARGPQ